MAILSPSILSIEKDKTGLEFVCVEKNGNSSLALSLTAAIFFSTILSVVEDSSERILYSKIYQYWRCALIDVFQQHYHFHLLKVISHLMSKGRTLQMKCFMNSPPIKMLDL